MDFQDNAGRDVEAQLGADNSGSTDRGRVITLEADADGVIRLPAGVTLDDIELRGTDLVIEMPDGTVYVIPNGATDVPVLVIDGVAVPPLNLAAYLVGEEPQPAAGSPQSSGGNFADPVGPIQAAYGLGNLLPYTELNFPEAPDEEVLPQAIDNEPAIVFVPAVGSIEGGTLVRESHLPGTTNVRTGESPGSASDGTPETTSGVIDFVSQDGLGSIVVAGVTLDPGSFPQTVVSDETGILVITAVTFDNGTRTGTVSYTYTLVDNTGDPESTLVTFPIEVIDTDGDSASDTLTIEIVDDVPTAAPDVDSVEEGGTATGNVLPNDEFGADGPAATNPAGGVVGVRAANGDTTTAVTTGTGTEIQGQYGTLVLNADGSYAYKADANIIDTDVVDVFVYTIRDGDPQGDESTTTLTINIADVTLAADNARVIVDEAAMDTVRDGIDLAPANTTGRTPGSTDESVAGSVNVAGAATYALVGSGQGAHGQIALAADGTFVYTLTSRVDNLPHADDGTETELAGDVFTFVATDANGNTVQGTITVDIIDDVPVATADVDTVSEGGSTSGDVLVNDLFGADGPASTAPAGGVIGVRAANGDTITPVTTGTGTTIQGEHGTLVLNADGTYTYQADADAIDTDVSDIFVYTIEDADGDRSTTTLTIMLEDVTLAGVDARVVVAEPALDTARDGADLAAGTVTGSSPASTGETVSGSVLVAGATSYTIVGSTTGNYGQIALNADGTFVYTLTRPVDNLPHADDGNETAVSQEAFVYQAVDANGNSVQGTIFVDIIDDTPTARADFNFVEEGSSVSGVVLPNDTFGADGPGATAPAGGILGVRAANGDTSTPVTSGVGTTIQGEFGQLVLSGNGSYTYTASGNVPADGVDVFVYTIIDGDGDRSTTTLSITVADTTVIVSDNDAQVDESGLDLIGSQIVPDGEFFTDGQITASGSGGPFTYELVGPATGTYGTLTLDTNTGAYSYTLTSPVDEPSANNGRDIVTGQEAFTYIVRDAASNIVGGGTINVAIVDDVPTAVSNSNSVVEGGEVGGNVLSNDRGGADGVGSVVGVRAAGGNTTTEVLNGVGTQITGEHGTLTLGANGTYTYEADQEVDSTVQDVFVYTMVDGDGDRSTTTLTITIINDLMPSAEDVDATLDDDALNNGIAGDNGDGSDDSPDTSNLVGTLPGSGGDGALTYSLGTGVVASGGAPGVFTYEKSGDDLLIKQDGVTVITVTLVASGANAGDYTITQNAPLMHASGDTENNQSFAITYTVKDVDNDEASATLTIDVDDDSPKVSVTTVPVPTLTVDESDLASDATGDFAPLFTIAYGADGAAAANPTTWSLASAGGDTGLIDTATGTAVYAALEGGDVVGRVGSGGAGAVVFVISVDGSGTVELDQQRAVIHTNTASNDEPTPALAAGLVSLTATATDKDGDSHSQSLDIGNKFFFEDDGPAAVNDSNTVPSGEVGPVTGNVLDNDDVGADVTSAFPQGKVTRIASDNVPANVDDTPSAGAFTVAGEFGTLTINEDGSYSYLRTDGTAGSGSDVFTYTMVDADGDPITAKLTVGISDAFPSAEDVDATLDDDALNNGIAGDNGDGSDDSPDTSNLVGTLPGSGGDGALTYSLGTGVVASGGAPGVFTYEKSGDDLLIKQDGVTVITVTLVASGANAGDYTITQNAPLMHASGDTENNQSFAITYTVKDVDNDEASATLTIDVDDDSPKVSVTTVPVPTLTVDESDLASDATGDFAPLFTIAYGADGAAAANPTTWSLASAGGDTGLIDTATGTAVYAALEGGDVVGRVGSGGAGAVVFVISVDGSGTVELDQQRAVIHTNTASNDEPTPALAAGLVSLTATATDKDGDSHSQSLDIGNKFFFEDDGPAAVNDSNTVPSGEVGPVTGNVLDNDDVGADVTSAFPQGKVTRIASDNVPANVDDTPSAGAFTVAGEFGTLTINEDGSYSYLRTDGTAGSGSDVFTYTMVDADGDPITAKLTVGISDAFPSAEDVDATLDDDALNNGIAGDNGDGSDDSPDTSNLVGTLPGSGGDGALTYSLGTGVVASGGAPGVFTYEKSGDDLLIKQDGVTVITVTLVASGANAGDYTITQNAPLMHASGDTENNQSFAITYTVKDVDNDEASATLTIDVDDDSPKVSVTTVPVPTLTVDESDLASDATGDFAPLFTIAYGADGAAAANPTTWSLASAGGDTGLIDTATGTAVYAALEGGDVVGRVGSGGAGAVVFVISVDGSGTVELDQQRAVIHTNTASNDEPTPALAAGLVSLTATATDKDGDSHSQSLDIGNKFFFEDDGPAAVNDSNTVPSGEVGPVTGNVLDNDDVGADVTSAFPQGKVTRIASDNVPANVDDTPSAGAFTVAGEFGTLTINEDGSYSYLRTDGTAGSGSDVFTYTMVDADGDPITAKLTVGISDAFPSAEDVDATLDDDALNNGIAGDNGDGSDDSPDTSNLVGTLPGSGGDGALTYSLGTGVVASGGAPGVFTYEKSGDDLLIKQDGVTVITVTLVASGANAGDYTITQNAPLMHASGDTENNQSFAITYTVKDVDNDEASATLTIDVDDDSPKVSVTTVPVPTLTVDESDLASDATGDFAPLFTIAYGADGAAAANPTTWSLASAGGDTGLIDTATGTAVYAALEGGDVVGRVGSGGAGAVVFVISVDGSGTVELDQQRAVIHTNTASNDEPTPALAAGLVSLTATATDKDGDSHSQSLDIGNKFFFEDDGPAAVNDSNTVPSGEVGPVTGNVLDNDDVGADVTSAFPQGKVTRIASDNVPANVDDTPSAGAFTVAGEFGTLTINEDGSYSYLRTDGTAGSGSDVFTYTMVDADGDPITAKLTVGISDAFPSAEDVDATLDDDALNNGIAGDNGDGSDDSPDTSNLVGTLPGSGGDGALTYSLGTGVVASGGAPGVFTYEKSGDDLLIKQDGVTVITVTLVASGANAGDYTITQNAPLMHASGDTENNQSFAITYTVKDVDNDEASATLTIDVDDDSPKVSVTTVPVPTLTVDESDLASDATGDFAPLFTIAYGADGAAAANPTTWSLASAGGDTGLIDTATGTAVYAALEGGDVVGRVGSGGAGAVVFVISVDGSGTVELDQQRAVIHTNTASNDEPTPALAAGLVSLTATATDKDGDSHSQSLDIGNKFFFEDDGPAAGANAQVFLDDETASTTYGSANPGGSGDYTGTPAPNTSGTLAHVFGADGAGSVLLTGATGLATYTGGPVGADKSFAAQVTGGGTGLDIWQVQNGSWVNVISVSVTAASGDYTVVQNAPVFHPTPGLVEEDQSFTITYQVKDGDNDTANSSFIVNVDDDTPELGAIPDDTVPNVANATGSGSFSYSPGADGHQSFGIVGPTLDGISYTLTQNASGALLSGKAAGNVTVFTLQVNTAGTYDFTLVTPEASVTETISLLDLAAGNSPSFAETGDGKIEFSSAGSINSSTQGFGVDNQFVANGESFTIEFHDPGTVGDQATTSAMDFVNSLSLTIQQIVGSVGFAVTVYNDFLNTSEVVYVNQATAVGSFVIDPVMSEFNRVTISGVSGSGNGARLTQLNVSRTILPSDVTLDFDVTATDGDGDTTVVSSFSIFVDAVTPVGVDLDGDGVEFLGIGAGVSFAYDDDGAARPTAWIGADDGILVRDTNGDGLVTSAGEFVFGSAGQTDLEALAAQYGTTLDAGDADFAKFAVWQDANGNGVSEAGELTSLADLGIVSIGLVSDGVGYSAANDDVVVHGEASFTRADGTTGTIADATFATGQARIETRTQEMAMTAVAAGIGLSILVTDTPTSDEHGAPLRIVSVEADPSTAESAAAPLPAVEAHSISFADYAPAASGEEPAAGDTSGIGDADTGSDSGARLVVLADPGADDAGSPGSDADAGSDGDSPFLIAAAAMQDAPMMEQLLLLGDGGDKPSTDGGDSQAPLDGILVDGAGEAFVDALVETLGADGHVGSGDTDLAGLLGSEIVTDHGLPLQIFDVAQTMEDMSAAGAA